MVPTGITADNHLQATVTSSLWCGTGVQILSPAIDGAVITLPSTNLATKLGFNKCIIVNLKPSVIDVRCELYTPFIYLQGADVYDDVPEWAEVECFWNPVRKTYQTLLPYEVYHDNGMSKDNFLRAVNLYLGADTTNGRGITNNVTWKFQNLHLLDLV